MNTKKAALLAALPITLPVFTGYMVLGAAFGILMDSKGFSLTQSPHALPEAISIAVIVFLHTWKKNTLLSIGGGALLYMFLVQFIFV